MVFGCVMIAAVSFGNDNKALAAKSGDYTYGRSGNGIVITNYTGKAAKVKIPARIAGRKVTSIGYGAFYNNKYVKNVTLPDSVKTIKSNAFRGCKKLKSIKLSKNLTKVKSYAFQECTSLKKISFPAKVDEVGGGCFKGCTSLETVSYSDNTKLVTMNCFNGCKSLKSFDFNGIEEIDMEAFAGCVSLKGELNLANVVEVERLAFDGCSGITGVTFSDSLQILGSKYSYDEVGPNIQGERSSNPFTACTGLTSYNIPATNVNFCSIDGILYGKSGEWLVAFPAGRTGEYTVAGTVKGIGESAFEGVQISKLTLPDSVKYVYNRAFKDSMISGIKLPDYDKAQTQYSGSGLFEGCTKLESFAFPEGMKDNSAITLDGCTSLKSVTFPASFENLKGEVFRGCIALNNVVLPEKITVIPGRCFYGCTSLSNINLDRIMVIGSEAFSECKALTGKLNLPAVTSISVKAFSNCTGITEVAVAASTSAIGVRDTPEDDDYYYGADAEYDEETGVTWDSVLASMAYYTNSNAFDGCSSLVAVAVPAENMNFATVDGCLYSKDMSELICVPAKKTGKFSVPYGVKKIAPMAFFATNVDSVVLSNSVRKIDMCAFAKCTMKSLTISKSVNTISEVWSIPTFVGCKNLAEIIVKSGNSNYESKDGILFSKDYSKKTLLCYPAAKKGKTYTTPKKCKIGGFAFDGCKYLKKLTIPSDSGISTVPVIASNCTKMNVYLSSKISSYNSIGINDTEEEYVVFGANTKKCNIYAKKNSKIAKRFARDGVSYKTY